MEDYKKLHTIAEVAATLRVTPRTVLRWCHARRLGYFSVSEKVFLIPDVALREFLEKARRGRAGAPPLSTARHSGQTGSLASRK